MEPENDLQIILIFKEVRPPFVTPFFAKEYQGIPKTKIKNVDLCTDPKKLDK